MERNRRGARKFRERQSKSCCSILRAGWTVFLILAMCSAPISHCVLCKRCQEELGFESAMFSCGGRYPSQSSHMMTSLPVC